MIEPARALMLAAAVFIPFERIASERPDQRVFRRGWATDTLRGFANGVLLFLILLIVLSRVDAIAGVIVPGVRAWV